MKKSFVFIGIITAILLISVLASSEENKSFVNISKVNVQGLASQNSSLSKADDLLAKEIVLPSAIQIPARIIFGIPESIKLEYLIVLLCLWMILFIILINVNIMFFEKKWMSVAAGLIILILLSITGTTAKIAMFLFEIWNVFALFKDWSFLSLLISVVILAAIFLVARIFLKRARKAQLLESAEAEAQKTKAGLQVIQSKYEDEKAKSG